MIQKISVENLETKNYTPSIERDVNNSSVSFTGLEKVADLAIRGMQMCESEPMVNVTVLDLLTAIGPRTVVETIAASGVTDENGEPVLDDKGKQKHKLNFLAGFEALRRESSGLLINCLLPGVFVIGAAKLLNGKIMGGKSNLTGNWADGQTLNTIQEFYKGTGAANYSSMIKNMFLDLRGVDGKEIDKVFAEIYRSDAKTFDSLFNSLGEIADGEKIDKKVLRKTVNNIIEKTKISENIKFTKNNSKDKYFGDSLESLLKNTVEVLHDAKKAGIESAEDFGKYISKAGKLVKWKSLGGLAITIPLALSAQPVNRWITHITAGNKKGAPIYNDEEERILSKDDKNKLLKQKFISIGSMFGLAWTSMMFKFPSMQMLEFKKFFPTMNQARLVSTATFASRMGASEDFNDLREATVRDLATFSSFYFLGDFAAKGIATFLEKRNPGVKLINELKQLNPNANVFEKMWHWARHTAIKSSNELTLKHAQNLRSICQLGNLAFSLISLGVFIPLYTRTHTKRKEQERKANTAKEPQNTNNAIPSPAGSAAGAVSETFPSEKSASEKRFGFDLINERKTAFGAFFNSQRK